MLSYKPAELDSKSRFLSNLQEGRASLKLQLDQMTADVEGSLTLSNDAVTQLTALHREYQRAISNAESEKSSVRDSAQRRIDDAGSDVGTGMAVGFAAAAVLGTILTGGLGGILFGVAGVSPGSIAGGASAAEKEAQIKADRDSALSSIEAGLSRKRAEYNPLITTAETKKTELMAQLKTAEQRKLYFGIVSELLLDNGINIARRLEQFASFNGTSVDSILAIEDSELRHLLERLLTGNPKASDVDRLLAISDSTTGRMVVTPELRTLKQFINQVVVPNKVYFDILASFADDIRAQDMSTFPPLEILGQKPISLSGRIMKEEGAPSVATLADTEASMLDKAKAKVEVRERIAGGAVYEVMKEDGTPHLEKMKTLVDANEEEIGKYADIFADVEAKMQKLEQRRLELVDQARDKRTSISDGKRGNAVLDGRILEIKTRNDAKQEAAKSGSKWRAGLAVGGGVVLAMIDGGVFSGPIVAKAAAAKAALAKGLKDSMHSVTYGMGQARSTAVENAMLDDYMHSLALQKVDVGALQTELAEVEHAIQETQKSKAYQELVNNEARRTHVSETLLLRSLIRNGYNNSDDINAICKTALARYGLAGVSSVDDFLDHYKGTRLGLALKKHCHGLADSNDISVILAEVNCLRHTPVGADLVLAEYVEETMKPNIASYYSKASKMDVIAQNNLTGFGNDLHFAAELQLETARAVRLLTANEYGMSVIGREDVRGMFDYWLHRHGDRRLYDDKIRDGEISDQEYPEKRVSVIPRDKMERFVDMAKRSVASGRASFPKVGDMFLRVCAHEYFLPQAIQVGGKDNIFTDYPQSPTAYPMVNAVVTEFIRRLSFSDINDFRAKVGDRLDNVIAQTFMDYFARLGELHEQDAQLSDVRKRLKDAANYDDYAPMFDRYAREITRDSLNHFDLFLDIYKRDLEKYFGDGTREDQQLLDEQLARVKDLANGVLHPAITRPGTHEARVKAYDECHTGENMLRRG